MIEYKKRLECKMMLTKILRFKIARYLNINDVISLCKVDRSFRQIVEDEYFWQIYFEPIYFIKCTKPKNVKWLEWYKFLENKKIFEMSIDILLVYAAEYGYLTLVKYAVQYHDCIKEKEHALLLASIHNHFDIVCYLVDTGTNIHAHNNAALRWSAFYGNLKMVKMLLNRGANIHINDTECLIGAVYRGHLNVVKYLVEKGVNNYIRNDQALLMSIEKGYFDITNYFIKVGANTHILTQALEHAAYDGHLNAVKYLVKHGANIHENQALENAALKGHFTVVKYLIENGIKVSDNALKNASMKGHSEILKYLIQHNYTSL